MNIWNEYELLGNVNKGNASIFFQIYNHVTNLQISGAIYLQDQFRLWCLF